MFAPPVTENEIEKVINKLKGKSSAGFDEIPEFLVKRCTHHIKKTPNPYNPNLEFSQIK